ncbi:MAG: DUF4012 domain-containing protein [Patescibacteria group bacterium]
MTTNLNIGPEDLHKATELPEPSKHVINLKGVDNGKKTEAHAAVSVDLKEEIKTRNQKPGAICIIGELPPHRRGLGRVPMVAAALLVIFVLNIGQIFFLGKKEGTEALALAGEAFMSLQGASESVISGEQGADLVLFDEAEKLFEEAKEKGAFLLQGNSEWLSQPKQVESLENLLDAGTLMAEVGQFIGEARLAFSTLPETGSLTDYLRKISEEQLEPVAVKLHQIDALLADVDLSGTEFESKFLSFKDKLSALTSFFDLWVSAKEPLLTALGDHTPQHYLVLLQNNDEMRQGGGFIGSVAIVELNDGRLADLAFHDVYDFDGRYFEHLEVPVHELKALTPEWRLRDSNISADFPISAEKAMWLLQEEGGPGVDGVIGLNLSAAQALLEDTGPLKLPSIKKEISAETFPAVISTLVEAKVNKTSPKAVLGELLTAFMDQMKSSTVKTSVALTAMDEAHKKQILFYHREPAVQELFDSLGLTGDLPALSEIDHDFFMPVFTNIGANKTDRYMETHLQHDTQIFEDGSMVSSVTVQRTHTYNAATQSWLKSTLASYGFSAWNPGLEQVLGNANNHSGIRLYIPANATILETEGVLRDEVQFYYDPLQDLSYYYVDQTVAPGTSESFTIHFALPWNFHGDFEEYDFDLFKQPGLKAITFEKTVTALSDTMLSGYPLATDVKEGLDYILSGPLQNDTNVKLLYR